MRRVLSVAVVAAIAALVVVPGAVGWSWPADGPLLRPFSLAADEYAAGQHRGIDIGAAAGDPVRAPAAGIVSFVGPVPAGGRALTIQTADGYAVTLLQLGSVAVTRGSSVGEGGVVGQVGDSEDAFTTAPHVHLGVRVAAEPNGYVDPLGLLPAVASPVPVAPETAPRTGPRSGAGSHRRAGCSRLSRRRPSVPVATPSLVSEPAPGGHAGGGFARARATTHDKIELTEADDSRSASRKADRAAGLRRTNGAGARAPGRYPRDTPSSDCVRLRQGSAGAADRNESRAAGAAVVRRTSASRGAGATRAS